MTNREAAEAMRKAAIIEIARWAKGDWEILVDLIRRLPIPAEPSDPSVFHRGAEAMRAATAALARLAADDPVFDREEGFVRRVGSWIAAGIETLPLPEAPPVRDDAHGWPADAKFTFGQYVRKRSGSGWEGPICGWYTTPQTPIGYSVKSAFHENSVQIWPEAALEAAEPRDDATAASEALRIAMEALESFEKTIMEMNRKYGNATGSSYEQGVNDQSVRLLNKWLTIKNDSLSALSAIDAILKGGG